MNVKHLTMAVVVFAAAGVTFAQQVAPDYYSMQQKTRQQVRAEFNEARAQGLIGQGEEIHYPYDTFIPKKTRDEVRVELDQARMRGMVGQGEEINYPYAELTTVAGTRSRDEVHQEAIQFARSESHDPDHMYDVGA